MLATLCTLLTKPRTTYSHVTQFINLSQIRYNGTKANKYAQVPSPCYNCQTMTYPKRLQHLGLYRGKRAPVKGTESSRPYLCASCKGQESKHGILPSPEKATELARNIQRKRKAREEAGASPVCANCNQLERDLDYVLSVPGRSHPGVLLCSPCRSFLLRWERLRNSDEVSKHVRLTTFRRNRKLGQEAKCDNCDSTNSHQFSWDNTFKQVLCYACHSHSGKYGSLRDPQRQRRLEYIQHAKALQAKGKLKCLSCSISVAKSSYFFALQDLSGVHCRACYNAERRKQLRIAIEQ